MKLLLIAPEGLEVQGFKGSKHVHHLNLAVVAALTPHVLTSQSACRIKVLDVRRSDWACHQPDLRF
jgi:hypothetical protein